MIPFLDAWWRNFIYNQFRKYFVVGGHCGLCGSWVKDALVDKDWAITVCSECLSPNQKETEP